MNHHPISQAIINKLPINHPDITNQVSAYNYYPRAKRAPYLDLKAGANGVGPVEHDVARGPGAARGAQPVGLRFGGVVAEVGGE